MMRSNAPVAIFTTTTPVVTVVRHGEPAAAQRRHARRVVELPVAAALRAADDALECPRGAIHHHHAVVFTVSHGELAVAQRRYAIRAPELPVTVTVTAVSGPVSQVSTI